MDQNSLELARAAHTGEVAKSGGSAPSVQRIRKFFTESEAIEAIKSEPVKVTLGNPAFETKEVTIYPLTPMQFALAYNTLKDVLLPIMGLYTPGRPAPEMPEILDVLGDKVAQLPKLLRVILQRSPNAPSEDWLNEYMDFSLDLQAIIPPFIIQNGLQKLFPAISGNVPVPASRPQTPENLAAETQTTQD